MTGKTSDKTSPEAAGSQRRRALPAPPASAGGGRPILATVLLVLPTCDGGGTAGRAALVTVRPDPGQGWCCTGGPSGLTAECRGESGACALRPARHLVVGYAAPVPLGRGTAKAETLLDAASHGPAGNGAGLPRRPDPGPASAGRGGLIDAAKPRLPWSFGPFVGRQP